MQAFRSAGHFRSEFNTDLLLAGPIRDQRVAPFAGNQLDIGRLDFVDLGLRAEKRDDRPLVGEALGFVIDHARGLVAFEDELVTRGEKGGLDRRLAFFGGLALRGLPESFQLGVRQRDLRVGQVGSWNGLSGEGKRSKPKGCQRRGNVFNHALRFVRVREALMKPT